MSFSTQPNWSPDLKTETDATLYDLTDGTNAFQNLSVTHYTWKVGFLVHSSIALGWSGKGSASGTMRLVGAFSNGGGFPIAGISITDNNPTVYTPASAPAQAVVLENSGSADWIRFRVDPWDGSGGSLLTAASFPTNGTIIFTMTYVASS